MVLHSPAILQVVCKNSIFLIEENTSMNRYAIETRCRNATSIELESGQ